MGDRGSCATGPYKTPTTLGHTTKSEQLYLIHRNTYREAAKTRRQRNMAQMKGHIKTPEKDLKKMEINNLSDAEFKTLLMKMLKELNEDLSSIKKIYSETKDTLIEIKIYRETTVEWMKPRIKSVIWNRRKQKKAIRKRKKHPPKTRLL